jgi:RNA polymerase sigma-70 factor, ECF subfamily
VSVSVSRSPSATSSPPSEKAEGTRARRASGTFLDLYEAEFVFVWRISRRLGVAAADLDDFVQEVFVVIHRRLGEFEGRSSIRTWIFAIVFRRVSAYRRGRRRAPFVNEEATDAHDEDAASPLDAAEQRERVALLHSLLDKLDDEKRAVFVLSELEQMSVPQIAEATQANVNTVYARLRAARVEFQQAYARHKAAAAWRER